jgi:hypothetical protein
VSSDLWLDHPGLGANALFNPQALPQIGGIPAGGGGYMYWANAALIKETGSICAGTGTTDCFVVWLAPRICAPNAATGDCGWANRGPDYQLGQSWGSSEASHGNGTHTWIDYDQCAALNIVYGPCYGNYSTDGMPAAGYMANKTMKNLADGRTIGGVLPTLTQGSIPVTVNGQAETITWRRIAIPDTTLGPQLQLAPTPSGSPAPNITTNYNVPATAGETDTDVQAALDPFDNVCGRALVNAVLKPSAYSFPSDCYGNPPAQEPGPSVIGVPGPLTSGETYTAYLGRLRAEGLTGTASRVTLPDGSGAAVPELGPGSVVSVQFGGPAWETLSWPSPLPDVAPGAAFTITTNPTTSASGGEPGSMIGLPQPQVGETAAQYRNRLRSAGFVGTIVLIELSPGAMPGEPPVFSTSEPVVIRVGSPVTQTIDLGSPWNQETPPLASPSARIEIDQAPATWPPRSEGEAVPPGLGGGTGGGSCDPWLEAQPDFGPLMALDFSDKFPFGLFVWVNGILGDFNTTPDAPSWSFDVPSLGGVDPGTFDVDLAFFDGYMSTIRTILTFVLWVGAVWYFATALLGLRSGNPGEAIEDA